MAAGDVVVDMTSVKGRAGAIMDGTDDRINCGQDASLNLRSDFTISMWLFPIEIASGIGGRRCCLSKNDKWILRFQDGGAQPKTSYYIDGVTGSINSDNAGDINLNEWIHIVYRFELNDFRIYKNGALIHTNTGVIGLLEDSAANDLYIGRQLGHARDWNGSISEVRIWNRLLSPTEIAALYAGEVPRDNLVSEWLLKDDYKDTAGPNDGTNTGSRLGILDEDVAAAVKAARTTANDQYIIAPAGKNQVITAVIEEA